MPRFPVVGVPLEVGARPIISVVVVGVEMHGLDVSGENRRGERSGEPAFLFEDVWATDPETPDAALARFESCDEHVEPTDEEARWRTRRAQNRHLS